MAKKTTLSPTATPGKPYNFSPKAESIESDLLFQKWNGTDWIDQSPDHRWLNQSLKTTDDVKFASVEAAIHYIGDPDTNGSWRMIASGNNLNFEKRESGSWVRKGDVRP